MYYLIYVSSATLALPTEALLQMLDQARSKNEKLGVTGMLLYKGGNFMQMLEGEKEIVVELFDTIRRDIRHHNVIQIKVGEIESRSFPNWSMGFTDMDTCEGLPKFDGYVQESLLDRKFRDDAKFAVQFMLTFNELNH